MKSDSLRVVIAGGGVAALEATLALRALAEDRISIELIAPEPDFVYRPLSVGDPFQVAETRRFPLAPLVDSAGGVLRAGRVTAVDPGRAVRRDGRRRARALRRAARGARRARARGAAERADVRRAGEQRGAEGRSRGGARRRRAPDRLRASGGRDVAAAALRAGAADGLVPDRITARAASSSPSSRRRRSRWPSSAGRRARRSASCSRRAGSRFISGRLPSASRAARADGARRRDRGRPRDRAPEARGPAPRRASVRPRRVHPDRRAAAASGPRWTSTPRATRRSSRSSRAGSRRSRPTPRRPRSRPRPARTVEPEPFKPVLRGLLLTGMVPRYLRGEPGTAKSTVDTEALWWPPSKIVGHYLAPVPGRQARALGGAASRCRTSDRRRASRSAGRGRRARRRR